MRGPLYIPGGTDEGPNNQQQHADGVDYTETPSNWSLPGTPTAPTWVDEFDLDFSEGPASVAAEGTSTTFPMVPWDNTSSTLPVENGGPWPPAAQYGRQGVHALPWGAPTLTASSQGGRSTANAVIRGHPESRERKVVQPLPQVACKESAPLAKFATVIRLGSNEKIDSVTVDVSDVNGPRNLPSFSVKMRGAATHKDFKEGVHVVKGMEVVARQMQDGHQYVLIWIEANRKHHVGHYSFCVRFNDEHYGVELGRVEIRSKRNEKHGDVDDLRRTRELFTASMKRLRESFVGDSVTLPETFNSSLTSSLFRKSAVATQSSRISSHQHPVAATSGRGSKRARRVADEYLKLSRTERAEFESIISSKHGSLGA